MSLLLIYKHLSRCISDYGFMCVDFDGIFRVRDMYSHVNERSGLASPLIADDVYEIIMKVK